MLDQIRKNFEYDHWANQKSLEAIQALASPPEKAVKIFGHILFAKDVWLSRLLHEDSSRYTDPWPPYRVEECGSKLGELHGIWAAYLKGLSEGDLGKDLRFKNTQGRTFEQRIGNILFQVAYHGHYHRGQLATLIALAGGKSPTTDYIAYTAFLGEGREIKE